MRQEGNDETAGIRMLVDGAVLDMLDATKPAGLTRTSWANLAIQIGIANAPSYLKNGHTEC